MNYETYAWVVEELDGREGIVAAIIPTLGPTPCPLIHSKREIVERMRPLAEAHAQASGRPVRLVHLLEVP